MWGIIFGVSSSLMWGTADFMGGYYTRRLSLAGVVVVSQAAGFASLIVLLLASGSSPDGRAVAIGISAGLCGAIGISTFYAALATGKMSIVSPVTACGALVPVALALAGGERPGTLALVGAAIALAGAVLASIHEYNDDTPDGGGNRRSIVLSVIAAVAIGGFLYLLSEASHDHQGVSALVGARVGSLSLLIAGSLLTRRSMRIGRESLPVVALIGVMDTSANGLFVLATFHGYLAIVSVLGSVYPIMTVLLAQLLLNERITRIQAVGVTAAIAGVAIVAAA